MNKPKFYIGLSMLAFQVFGVIIYLLTTLDYSWITKELIRSVIVLTCFGLFNITSIILTIVGIFQKEE